MAFKRLRKTAALTGLLGMTAFQSVWAALPTPVAPSTAPAAGDWIELIKGYIKDGGLVLGLAIAVLGFLWVAHLGFAKFNEARQGKAGGAQSQARCSEDRSQRAEARGCRTRRAENQV